MTGFIYRCNPTKPSEFQKVMDKAEQRQPPTNDRIKNLLNSECIFPIETMSQIMIRFLGRAYKTKFNALFSSSIIQTITQGKIYQVLTCDAKNLFLLTTKKFLCGKGINNQSILSMYLSELLRAGY